MEKAVGMVRFQPAPDFERLKALMQEEPREIIAQAKHFLYHSMPDHLIQAKTYNLMCYTAVSLLKRSTMEALFHGHEAVRLARDIDGLEAKALLFDSLVNLGAAAERVGEFGRAVESYREALELPLDLLERRHYEELVITNMGRALAFQGSHAEALEAFDRASAIAARRSDPYADEPLHTLRAACYVQAGNLAKAEEHLTLAARLMNNETRYELAAKCRHLTELAVLRMLQGVAAEAAEYARGALEIAAELDDPPCRVKAKLVKAWELKGSRRVQQSTALAGEATAEAFSYGYAPLIQTVAWLLGHLYRIPHGGVGSAYRGDC